MAIGAVSIFFFSFFFTFFAPLGLSQRSKVSQESIVLLCNMSKGRGYSALVQFEGLRRNVIATTTNGIACLGATIMPSQS